MTHRHLLWAAFAATLGLDAAVERKRIEREKEAARDQAGQGTLIRPEDIGLPGEGEDAEGAAAQERNGEETIAAQAG